MGLNKRANGRGFTLIELLVVISIIALLLAILIPSLGKAKDHARKIGCSTNLRTLSLAARLYANDHDGLTPSSTNYWTSSSGQRAGWCGRTGTNEKAFERNIQIDGDGSPTAGLRNGQLWNYIETHKGWGCPADPDKEQLRSYGMAAQWWGQHYRENLNSIHYDGGRPKVYKKITGIPNASSRFLFVDQLGYNADAYAAITYSSPNWWNIPNFLHSGGSVNGYADGHVKAYKFTKATVDLARASLEAKNPGFMMNTNPPVKGNSELEKDLIYYQKATWGGFTWTP